MTPAVEGRSSAFTPNNLCLEYRNQVAKEIQCVVEHIFSNYSEFSLSHIPGPQFQIRLESPMAGQQCWTTVAKKEQVGFTVQMNCELIYSPFCPVNMGSATGAMSRQPICILRCYRHFYLPILRERPGLM